MTGLVRAIAAGLLALAAALGGCHAEDRMHATLGKPAIVTAMPATAAVLDGADIGTRQVLIGVVAFTPPPDKRPVEAVVSVRLPGGSVREIGRFSIMPSAPFGAGDPSKRQNFALPLPPDLAGQQALTLSIALVAVSGGGQGASLDVGSAAIR
jgi:hypothetical protein